VLPFPLGLCLDWREALMHPCEAGRMLNCEAEADVKFVLFILFLNAVLFTGFSLNGLLTFNYILELLLNM